MDNYAENDSPLRNHLFDWRKSNMNKTFWRWHIPVRVNIHVCQGIYSLSDPSCTVYSNHIVMYTLFMLSTYFIVRYTSGLLFIGRSDLHNLYDKLKYESYLLSLNFKITCDFSINTEYFLKYVLVFNKSLNGSLITKKQNISFIFRI